MPLRKYLKERVLTCISNQYLSYLLLLTAPFFWVGAYIFPNQHSISPIETNFSRYLLQFLTQYSICFFKKEPLLYRNHGELKIMVLRGMISAVNGLIISFVMFYLPLSIVHTVTSTATIFIFVLNYLIYHVKVTTRQIYAVSLAFVGILLTINGRLVYSLINPNYQFETSFDNYRSDDPLVITMVTVGLLLWMVIWAYAIIITNKTNFSFNEVLLLNSSIGLFIFSTAYMTLEVKSPPDIFLELLVWSGGALTMSNYLFNFGLFISENIGLSSMVNQFIIVVGYGFSLFRYKQDLNVVSLVGTLMLIFGIYIILVRKE